MLNKFGDKAIAGWLWTRLFANSPTMVINDAMPPAVRISRPAGCPSPVIFSVPHAGRHFPPEFLAMARVDRTVLARLGDSWCDLLVAGAARAGAATIIADYARAVADCNRGESDMAPDEVAPELRDQYTTPGRKERAGLGVVPTRLAPHGALWLAPIDGALMAARLDALHRPYHAAIAAAIETARKQYGWALLIDLHSMPMIPMGQQGHGARIVIGDAFGKTCASWMSDLAAECARALAVKVSVNQPYAGGHIIRRHSDPARGIHGLQIEIERRLYLDATGQPVAENVAALSDWLARLVRSLTQQQARDDIAPLAAE